MEQGIRARSLVALALDALARQRLTSGLFPYELANDQAGVAVGSVRYTLMAAIGLARAEASGFAHGIDVEALADAVDRRARRDGLAPGDLGLSLWLDSRLEGGRGVELTASAARALAYDPRLRDRPAMEVAWLAIGLAEQLAADRGAGPERLLPAVLDELLSRQADSGLFRYGVGLRNRFPNFADEIYAVLALALVASHGLDDRAAPASRRAVDALLFLQLPDGAWPWLYDASRGCVVERYELYAVHQDAMAPMALLELAAVTGERRYAQAALDGLEWLYGRNELGVSMVDLRRATIARSIRRRRPWGRLLRAANAVATGASGRPLAQGGRILEINPTCRPYHLGWILEAWCGRDLFVLDAAEDVEEAAA